MITIRLAEAVTTWYRGSHATNPFELRQDGNSTDQYGGGFYLTNLRETAEGYGRVGTYKINTDATFVTSRTKVNATVIDSLMRASPELNDFLENWDQNPAKAFRLAKENFLEYAGDMLEALKMIEFDMYRGTNPKAWMEACVSVGINGKIIKISTKENFLILYNTARAKTQQTTNQQPVRTSSPSLDAWFGQSKIVDTRGKPLRVYHGTSEKFSRFSLSKTTQGIIWFTTNKTKIERGEVGAQGHGVIMELFVKMERPAGWDDYDRLSLGELKRDFDGAILPDGDGHYDGFVFNPNQIRKAT